MAYEEDRGRFHQNSHGYSRRDRDHGGNRRYNAGERRYHPYARGRSRTQDFDDEREYEKYECSLGFDISRSNRTKGFVRLSDLHGFPKSASNFARVDRFDAALFRYINIRHENILQCHFLKSVSNYGIVSFEEYSSSLEEFYEVSLFWILDSNNRIIGILPLMQQLIKDIVAALGCLEDNDMCHRCVSSSKNIVTGKDGKFKLRNFSSALIRGNIGEDLKGLANLIVALTAGNNTMYPELDSFVSLLRAYPEYRNIQWCNDHPLLFSEKKRKSTIVDAGSSMGKNHSLRNSYSQFVRGDFCTENLYSWKGKVDVYDADGLRIKNCFECMDTDTYPETPGGLMHFARSTFVHCNDLYEKPEYTDHDILETLRENYPNLLIEWFRFGNKIPSEYLTY